jgi:hypothetical protein
VTDNLPKEIKDVAKFYAKNIEHSYADNREELEEDVEEAWLQGFMFCLEGHVHIDWEWTPVKEKLPKESGDYLVSCHLPLIDKEYITTSRYYAGEYRWDVEVPKGDGYPAPIVKAWKPLPKPYKE